MNRKFLVNRLAQLEQEYDDLDDRPLPKGNMAELREVRIYELALIEGKIDLIKELLANMPKLHLF